MDVQGDGDMDMQDFPGSLYYIRPKSVSCFLGYYSRIHQTGLKKPANIERIK
jgi:hypothetical protein